MIGESPSFEPGVMKYGDLVRLHSAETIYRNR
jgi:hypothetical protein